MRNLVVTGSFVVSVLSVAAGAFAQAVPGSSPAAAAPRGAAAAPRSATSAMLPPRYVIGPEDVLSIVFWRHKDMSADVVVRPDGKISLPLLNDIDAAGLTPEQLNDRLAVAAGRFVQDPTATVVVKEIHSRKVFITGNVAKPGSFPLMGDTTVLQLIALAGGLSEYANSKNIKIMRTENGRAVTFPFDYKAVIKQKHLEQNILLKPNDTVIVP
jgi:polysaccharide export outer membrane protein